MSVQLWSGPRWATGSQLLAICDRIVSAQAALRLDQTHELVLDVEPEAEWLDLVTPRCSLWLPDHLPEHPEWRLAGRSRNLLGTTQLNWVGIAAYLGDLGPVTAELDGLQVSSLRGANLNALNYLLTWVLPHLLRRGVDWIGIGEVSTARQFDLSWEGISTRELLDAIAVGAECEWRLVPVEGGYLVDLVERVGAGAEEVWISESRDLLELTVDQPRDRLATVLRPMGDPSAGDDPDPSRATIQENAWRVVDVAGDVVQVAGHRGGRGPILEDGQFAGAIAGVAPDGYALSWGASVAEIVATTAPDLIEVADATGLAVGMDVMFVRRGSGGEAMPLTELPSPAGIAVSGVIAAPVDLDGGGSRNWAPNPFLRDVQGSPVSVGRRQNSSASTTRPVQDLPASTVWPTGSQVAFAGAGGTLTPQHMIAGFRLTDEATSDGSGNADLALDASSSDSGGSLPPVYILDPPAAPPGWDLSPASTAVTKVVTQYVRSTPRAALSAEVVGPHNFSATSPYIPRRVTLTGLEPGSIIYPGDRIIGPSLGPMMALEEVEAPVAAPGGSPPAVMADSVAYWRFAAWDGSGGAVPDESGNGHDAVLPGGENNPLPRGGGLGPGLYFRGPGGPPSYLEVADHADLDFGPSDDYTVVAVVRGPVANDTVNALVSKMRPVASGGYWADSGFYVSVTGSQVRHEIGGTPTVPALLVEHAEAATTEIRELVAIRDADTEIRVAGTSGETTEAGTRGDLGNGRPLLIGCWKSSLGSILQAFRGTMLGMAIFDRILDPSEVSDAAEWISAVALSTVTVAVADPTALVPNWADATAVTIERPPVPWLGDRALATWVAQRSELNELSFTTPLDLPFIRPGQTIRARAVWALGGWHATTWLSGATTAAQNHAPQVRIRRTDTNSVVASSTLSTLSPAAGQWVQVVLEATWAVPDPVPPLQVEIILPGGTTASGGSQRWQALPLLLGASLDYAGGEFPLIEGSQATRLWQDAAEHLRVSRAWSSMYQGSRLDVAAGFGLDPASPALELGGEVRLRAPSLAVDELLRVREVSIPDVLQPPGSRQEVVTLDMDPVRISTATTLRAGAPLYVQEGDQPRIASTAPPRTPGVIGAAVPEGSSAPTTFEALALGPIDA